MNTENDAALNIKSPRILTSIYYASLSIIATIFIIFILYLLGFDSRVHLLKSILVSTLIFSLVGALFGKLLIYSDKTRGGRIFLYGFLMVLIALPFYNLFLLYFIQQMPEYALNVEDSPHLMLIYSFVLLYTLFGAAPLLGMLSGFAALFLRRKFVYNLVHLDEYIHRLKPKKIRKKPSSHPNDTKTP